MRTADSLPTCLLRLAAIAAVLAAAALAPSLPSRAAPAPKPVVKTVDGPGLKKAVAALKGKVVLVNLWATWCDACVEEFPDLVKLANAYRPKGLVVLAVSLDEPSDRGKVSSFMAQQQAGFPTYLRSKGDIDAFIDPLDKDWVGAAPTTYVYGRNGKPAGKPLVGLQSYAQFEAAIKSALK
jgi:thiol-disulfide isomerase/thioredoxin